jgi:acyl-CoA thioester hydrolase
MKDYPYVCPIQVRWRDLDAFSHVNNAVFVTYLEVARAELWKDRFGGTEAGDIPFVIARVEMDYRRPIGLYEQVEVGLRVCEVAGASFELEYRIEADGALAAQARTVQVCIRPESGRPVRVPDQLRQGLAELMA